MPLQRGLDINTIIERNMGLVYKQLNKFHFAKNPDAISLAYEALYNAIITYQEGKGAEFSTYASVCIYNALGSYLRTCNKQRQLEVISYNNVLDDGTEYLEVLPASENIEDAYIQRENNQYIADKATTIINTFNGKRMDIVHLWRESEYTLSATDLAKEVGCSQSYASETLNIFKGRFRKALEESNC